MKWIEVDKALHIQAKPRRAAEMSKKLLRRTTDYMRAHLGDDVSLSAIADELSLSPHHLAHLFKQTTGLAPHQYVMQQRMARAKTLLSDSDLSLAQIATDLGFADQSHFGTLFKKRTGLTPKGYRDLC